MLTFSPPIFRRNVSTPKDSSASLDHSTFSLEPKWLATEGGGSPSKVCRPSQYWCSVGAFLAGRTGRPRGSERRASPAARDEANLARRPPITARP